MAEGNEKCDRRGPTEKTQAGPISGIKLRLNFLVVSFKFPLNSKPYKGNKFKQYTILICLE